MEILSAKRETVQEMLHAGIETDEKGDIKPNTKITEKLKVFAFYKGERVKVHFKLSEKNVWVFQAVYFSSHEEKNDLYDVFVHWEKEKKYGGKMTKEMIEFFQLNEKKILGHKNVRLKTIL